MVQASLGGTGKFEEPEKGQHKAWGSGTRLRRTGKAVKQSVGRSCGTGWESLKGGSAIASGENSVTEAALILEP